MNDMINGLLFELIGGLLLWKNVAAIRRDKKIAGVDWRPTVFYFTWGIWNLYYYPSLGQWFSFLGGILIVTANGIWLLYVYKYREK